MSYRVATILTSSYKLRYEKYKNRLVEIYNAMFQTFVLYYIFDYLIIRDDCRIYPMALVQLIWVPPTFLPKLAPTITELFFQILFYWIAFDFSYFWFHLLHHRVSFAVFFNLFAFSGDIKKANKSSATKYFFKVSDKLFIYVMTYSRPL